MEMPFKGSLGEKLEEYVKRVGIYITYIFMRNSNRAGINPQFSAVRNDYDEWVNDCISPVLLLEWFNNVFYSKSGSNNYDKLAKDLNTHFTKYIKNLETSEKMYYDKVFPFLHQRSRTGAKHIVTQIIRIRRKEGMEYLYSLGRIQGFDAFGNVVARNCGNPEMWTRTVFDIVISANKDLASSSFAAFLNAYDTKLDA